MMHGMMEVRLSRGFKPKAGQAYNVRGCLAVEEGSITHKPLEKSYMERPGLRYRSSMSCARGGCWTACYECNTKYESKTCNSSRKKGRVLHYRMIYFHRILNRSVYTHVWEVSGVWEDGYR